MLLLSDASLATAQQPFTRPDVQSEWLASPVDASLWDEAVSPFDWDPETGLSSRPIPGQRGGEYPGRFPGDPMAGQPPAETKGHRHVHWFRGRPDLGWCDL